MSAYFRNSLLAAFLLTLVLLGGSAFAFDETVDYYRIYDNNLTFLWLDDTDPGGVDWFVSNNAIVNDAFCVSYNTGSGAVRPFFIEYLAPDNSLYVDYWGRIGINTNVPGEELQINSTRPAIRLVDTSAGAGQVDLDMEGHRFTIFGDSLQGIFRVDTRAPFNSFSIYEDGNAEMSFSGSNTVGDGTAQKLTLKAYNWNTAYGSDVGFSMENAREGFTWIFRTYEPAEGFTASKISTGGAEFLVRNTTNDYRNASLHMGNGAQCSAGGQWINASSRDYKENIQSLTTEKALDALASLKPVTYNFKRDEAKDLTVGFIAEDVPDLVATTDRKGLNSLEIVATLTKVVQDQQEKMETQQARIEELSMLIKELQKDKLTSPKTSSL